MLPREECGELGTPPGVTGSTPRHKTPCSCCWETRDGCPGAPGGSCPPSPSQVLPGAGASPSPAPKVQFCHLHNAGMSLSPPAGTPSLGGGSRGFGTHGPTHGGTSWACSSSRRKICCSLVIVLIL